MSDCVFFFFTIWNWFWSWWFSVEFAFLVFFLVSKWVLVVIFSGLIYLLMTISSWWLWTCWRGFDGWSKFLFQWTKWSKKRVERNVGSGFLYFIGCYWDNFRSNIIEFVLLWFEKNGKIIFCYVFMNDMKKMFSMSRMKKMTNDFFC